MNIFKTKITPDCYHNHIFSSSEYIEDIIDTDSDERNLHSEPRYFDDQVEIPIKLDAIIYIESDGSWEYDDTNYPWAKSDYDDTGNWYADTDYGDILIRDPVSLVEDVDSLLETFLPIKKGTFYIKGNVNLIYDISKTSGFIGVDESEKSIYDDQYDLSDSDIEFNFKLSSISDFSIDEIK